MQPEDILDYHIKTSWLAISRMYNQIATRYGLTYSQGNILLIIDREGGTPATQIGPLLGMGSTGLSRLLGSMEENGLIRRKGSASDRRKVMVTLTKKGLEKRKIASDVVKDFNKYLLSEVSRREFATFKKVISKVNTIVESYQK